jgi:hypothetical protein
MTGQQLCESAVDGDTTKVSTLLSTQGAQSFINYQYDQHGGTVSHWTPNNGGLCAPQRKDGFTLLRFAAQQGHETVTELRIVVRCNVDLQTKMGPLCSTWRPKMGIRSSRKSSWQLVATSSFCWSMGTHRSTPRSQKDVRKSRNSSLLLAVTSIFCRRMGTVAPRCGRKWT